MTADEIRTLEDKRYQAMTDGDVTTLSELFADDLVFTHSTATWDGKQSLLDKIAAGKLGYGPIDHPVSSIVVRGDLALVYADMRGEVVLGGQQRLPLNSRTLAVWVREDGNWALLAFQATRYPS